MSKNSVFIPLRSCPLWFPKGPELLGFEGSNPILDGGGACFFQVFLCFGFGLWILSARFNLGEGGRFTTEPGLSQLLGFGSGLWILSARLIFGGDGRFTEMTGFFGFCIGSEGSRVDGILHIVDAPTFCVDLVGFTTLIVDIGLDTCITLGGGSPGNFAIFVILDKDPEI